MRKSLVVDANLLVLLTVGLADKRYISRHKRLYPIYRTEHWDWLFDVVRRAPALVTTTHALTEASNLMRQCAEPMRSAIMIAFARLIHDNEELTPPAREAIAKAEFVRLGLTDAAFATLDRKRYRILSADLDLAVALEKLGFEVLNFQRLVFD